MIHQALVGAPFGVKAQRRLVLQSPMSRVQAGGSKSSGGGGSEERIYILFSDMLVFVRPKQEGNRTLLQFRGMAPLERARVKPIDDTSIEITSPIQGVDTLNTTFVGSSSVHIMQTESKDEQERWLKHLQCVIEELDRAARAAAAKGKLSIMERTLAINLTRLLLQLIEDELVMQEKTIVLYHPQAAVKKINKT